MREASTGLTPRYYVDRALPWWLSQWLGFPLALGWGVACEQPLLP